MTTTKSIVAALAPVVLLLIGLHGLLTYVVGAFEIPTSSMRPTLLPGDHIVTNKNAYGWGGGGLPAYGDTIVFEFPYPAPKAPRTHLVKRVVGRPGDTLKFEEGHLTINGWPVPRCRVGPLLSASADVFVEFIGRSAHLTVLEQSMHPLEGPYTVPQGQVWVVGDNRDDAYDSRQFVDPTAGGARGAGVPLGVIKGRALRLWLPLDRLWISLTGDPVLPAWAPGPITLPCGSA